MKKLLALILTLALVLPLVPVISLSAAATTSGTTGNCTWTLDGRKLTITGNGTMGNYDYSNGAPWGTSVKEVIIEKGVTSIGYCAFKGCTYLTSITIPDSVTSIGGSAFYDCRYLTDITIPGSVTYIGDWAFFNCISLADITIPDSVTSIDFAAFFKCSSFTTITIPNSVTSIGSRAFGSCDALDTLTVVDGNPVYHSKDNCIIETDSKTLIAGCKNSVIPADGSVTGINDRAFEGCTSLVSITIPDSVTTLGSYAFSGCSALASITIPDRVTTLGSYAFYRCSSLADVWYEGNSDEREMIAISESGNEAFNNATWHYDSCMKNSAEKKVHVYDDHEDLNCNLCGYERPAYTPGDVDGVEGVTADDAVHLLFYVVFPERYEVNQPVDFDKSGTVDTDDAIYLLFHVMFPERYPL